LEPRLAPANVAVLQRAYDNNISGLNAHETTLTPANVGHKNAQGQPDQFGKLFNAPVDGYVYAQPLYLPNLTIAGGTHNVVFAATEHDTVYAIDGDNPGPNGQGVVLWQRNLGPSVPQPDVISGDIVPEIGITGTPVIDPTTNVMYVVAKTKETVGGTAHYVQRLYALNTATGADALTPVVIGDTTIGGPDGGYTDNTNIAVRGGGAGSDAPAADGILRFNALRENQRPALQLSNGIVYVTFASHGDNGPYHGWVVGYSASNLSLQKVFNASPNGSASGIWMSGGGIAADAQGNLYFATGNGFGTGFAPTPVNLVGTAGGGLGYQWIGNSLAVTFRTFDHSSTGLGINGAFDGSTVTDLGGTTGIDFNAGAQATPPHVFQAHLTYSGTTLTETITDLTAGGTPFTKTYNNINLTSIVGGNTAWVGFTGGTGGLNANQDIQTWTYSTGGTTVIDHSTGFASNSDLQANGNSGFTGTVARITTAGNGQAGTVFTKNQVNVTNFDTTFNFQMSAGSNPIADGMTFTIQNAAQGSFSESVLKLSPTGQLSVADYFTPFDWKTLDANDADLGSGGTMLLPDAVGSAAHPHLMIETGKTGRMYLIDRDNMGKNTPGGPDNVVQTVTIGGPGVWGNPAFFLDQPGNLSGLIYYWGTSNPGQAFRITNGVINPTPVATPFSIGFPGAQPSISANGTDGNSAILWALRVDNFGQKGPEELMAFKAEDLSQQLYSSNGTSLRDNFGASVKFNFPIVTNGHVYAATEEHLTVFGLFPTPARAADAPSNLTGTAIQGGTQVQLNWTNPPLGTDHDPTGIKILRSIDGVNFTVVAQVDRFTNTYLDSSLTPATLYHYRVVATNQAGDSPPSNTFDIRTRVAAPVLKIDDICTGSVTLRWTATANDHYSLERSTDGVNFTVIAGSIPASQTTFTDTGADIGGLPFGTYTYRVTGFSVFPEGPDSAVSNLASATIGPVNIDHGAPNGNPGFLTSSDMQANGSAFFSTDEHLLRLTNNFGQAGSAFTVQQVGIRGFTTSFQFRLHEGTQPNPADGLTFTIQANNPQALGFAGGALAYQGIGRSVAVKFDIWNNEGETFNSTGLFFDGHPPTVPHFPGEVNIPLDPNNVNLRSQSVKTITLTYDGVAHTLAETIHDPTPGQINNGDFTTTYTVDIAGRLGVDTAFAGFTGGTGGAFVLQDVLNWRYTEQEGTLPPRAPTNTRVQNVSNEVQEALTIRWNCNNAYTAQGFVIERSRDGTNFTQVAKVGVNQTTYTDTDLDQGAFYYRVRSFNAVGVSQPSNVTSVFVQPDESFTLNFPTFNDHNFLTQNGAAHFTPNPIAVGTFLGHQDIGNTTAVGNATFDSGSGTYTLNASGGDIWNVNDQFQYVYKPLTGDGEIVVRALNIQNTDFWAKGGVMIRESLDSNSKNAFMFETSSPDHEEPVFQWRTNTTGPSADFDNHIFHLQKAPVWLRLVRSGNNFSGFWAHDNGDGTHGAWNEIGTPVSISMNSTVFVGLGLTAHNNDGRINTSTFDNVTITGNTSAPLPATVARLTDGDFGEAGTVFTKNQISFNDFTTSFTYQESPRVGAADGLSFILQADPRGANAVGGAGGGLGYTGIANSVAIKFDIWNLASHRSSTGIYFDGEPPDSPAGRARSIFMDTDPNNVINFNSGHVFRIDLAYSSSAHVLTETVTDTVTHATFSTSYNVDVAAHLGSNVAYVGFGGGTGGETAVQDVLTWTYHSGPATGGGGGSDVPQFAAGGPAASRVMVTGLATTGLDPSLLIGSGLVGANGALGGAVTLGQLSGSGGTSTSGPRQDTPLAASSSAFPTGVLGSLGTDRSLLAASLTQPVSSPEALDQLFADLGNGATFDPLGTDRAGSFAA
jgi:hypothetical protein